MGIELIVLRENEIVIKIGSQTQNDDVGDRNPEGSIELGLHLMSYEVIFPEQENPKRAINKFRTLYIKIFPILSTYCNQYSGYKQQQTVDRIPGMVGLWVCTGTF